MGKSIIVCVSDCVIQLTDNLDCLSDVHTVNKKVYISALNPCLKHSHSTQKGCQNLKIFFTVSVALIWHLLAPLYCLYNSLQVDI